MTIHFYDIKKHHNKKCCMKKLWQGKKQKESSIEAKRSLDILAPRIIVDKLSPLYKCVEELRLAMNHSDCLNIALTGGYGSGKSSVIKTFLKENGDNYNYLRISLSNFADETNAENYENQIESKIFQHILYKANHRKTCKTEYKRIHDMSDKMAVFYSAGILLFLLSVVFFFEPEFFHENSLYELYHRIFNTNFVYWVNWICGIACYVCILFSVGFVLYTIIRRIKPITIKSIKAEKLSLDFDSKKSAFKELLGEILYFFKAGGYNLVIFEDLDRIKKPQNLFLKFIEINQLLNESDGFRKNNKKIRFVYAIRDDVFTEEVRTKCFDYMIPVVPIIDRYNAGDYLISCYRLKDLNEIDEKDINALSMYIGTMRELTNIMNEYRVYKDVLLKRAMSQTKLLASIIYKNSFPSDYSEYHLKKGRLYNVIHSKCFFSRILTESDEALLARLDEQIKNNQDSIFILRRKVVAELVDKHNIKRLIINEAQYDIEKVVQSDELFELLQNNKFDHYYYEQFDEAGYLEYTYKFLEIVSSIDENGTYCFNMEHLERDLSLARTRRSDCINRIRLTSNLRLMDVIKKIDQTDKTKEIVANLCKGNCSQADEKQVELIHTFIRNGYIEEDFDAYITYTYAGSKSSADFTFLHSVLQGQSLPYDSSIDHPEEIIKLLHTSALYSKEILNFDFVEYLLLNDNKAYEQPYFDTVRGNLDFVVKYYESGRLKQVFTDMLFYNWDNCVENIIKQDNQNTDILFELLFAAASTTCVLKSNEISILSEKYKFLCDRILKFNISKLKRFISHFHIRFETLASPNEQTKEMFNYVIDNSFFVINFINLKLIYGKDFDKKSYTVILDGNVSVKKYLHKNIQEVFTVFPLDSKEETTEAIAALSHIKDIKDDAFEQYLAQQTNRLSNLKAVNKERIPLFFKTDKIIATWDNIKEFFTVCDDTSIIVSYIISHASELEKYKMDENENKSLQLLLMNNNTTLPFEVFEKLLSSCNNSFDASEITDLNAERLRAILEADLIEYNEGNSILYSSKDAELFGDYIVHFFRCLKNGIFNIDIPNKTGITVLNSKLTLAEKKYFIDMFASPDMGNDIEEYSRLICFYYQQMDIDQDTNVSVLINAMDMSKDKVLWKEKIDLINRINRCIPYDETMEKALINSLRGEYLTLNTYRGVSHFDDNQENRTLLSYLLSKGHYVNKILEEENGKLKVTFKNSPS